jgi:hypothetical protein
MQSPDPVADRERTSSLQEQRDQLHQNREMTQAKMEMEIDDDDKRVRYQADLDRIQGLVDMFDHDLKQRPAFGTVWASSGYRVNEEPVSGGLFGCTLDWALIKVNPDRVGRNEVRERFPFLLSRSPCFPVSPKLCTSPVAL